MDIKIQTAAYVNPYEKYNAAHSIPDVDEKLTESAGADTENNEILGIGFLPADSDGVSYGMKCRYADNSTPDNPVIRVEVSRGGGRVDAYNININDIDTHNASELEMFALCSYADSVGAGTGGTFGSWQTFKYYSVNAQQNGYIQQGNTYREFANAKYDWNKIIDKMMQDYITAGLNKQALDGKKLLSVCREGMDTAKINALNNFVNSRIKTESQVPYSYLADESGNITYNGVVFNCNNEKQAICLGDVSNMDNVLTISLSGGGCLMVNRDNIGSLAKAIGMFSPEDMGIIMRAIAQDNQLKGNLKELEDIKDGDFHSSDNYKRTWESSFKGAAQGVEDAWKSAMEDTGIEGFGFDKDGKLTHIPQILVARLTKDSGMSVFGNTVESALRFAEKALSELNVRLQNRTENEENVSARENERQFYQVFIDKLKALS